jgi:histidinol phosphatase-like PHP family hydrolase
LIESFYDKIIDFHTHTQLSDGVLLPAEHVRHALINGYGIIGIADHVDAATIESVLKTTILLRNETEKYLEDEIQILANVELTHIPPGQFEPLTVLARGMGAEIVIAHGETLAESVYPGTNHAAIEARVDILAHPGLITEEEAGLAKEYGIYLEITQKWGHNISNGHVAKIAKRTGAKLIISSDAHSNRDMLSNKRIIDVCLGAGLDEEDLKIILNNNRELAEKILGNRKD